MSNSHVFLRASSNDIFPWHKINNHTMDISLWTMYSNPNVSTLNTFSNRSCKLKIYYCMRSELLFTCFAVSCATSSAIPVPACITMSNYYLIKWKICMLSRDRQIKWHCQYKQNVRSTLQVIPLAWWDNFKLYMYSYFSGTEEKECVICKCAARYGQSCQNSSQSHSRRPLQPKEIKLRLH